MQGVAAPVMHDHEPEAWRSEVDVRYKSMLL
jgi:hypothetical protein